MINHAQRIHTPRFQLVLLIFPLMSWAWLCQSWLAPLLMISLIVLADFGPWRWVLTKPQFYRCADSSSFLVLLLLLDVYWLQPVEQGIFVLLKWLPFLFAPVLLAQLFSDHRRTPLAALFFSMRKQNEQLIDIVVPYSGLTMLSAGVANVQNPSYFVLIVVWLGLVLWQQQSSFARAHIWLFCMLGVVISSYLAQQGLLSLQKVVEEKSVDLLTEWESDPFRGETSIGDIGELKLSSKIEFRVKANHPLLLQQASFDRYVGQTWSTTQRQFLDTNPQADNGKHQQLEIIQTLYRDTVLALPDGTISIQGLEDGELQYTSMGAVKVKPNPRVARFNVRYTGKRSGAITPQDFKIPRPHQDWLKSLAAQLHFDQQKPQQIAQTIQNYFQQRFRYSLYLGQQRDSDLALREFMLERQAGHCEYFAVATVFLLRQAGIPARLANGYAVSEYDANNGWYIVRSRHAHAWAIAYIDGYWQAVDSTPSRWAEMEAQQDEWWQPVADICSNLWLELRQAPIVFIGVFFGVLLLLYLVIRFYRASHQLRRAYTQPAAIKQTPALGLESALYRLEQRLAGTAQARQIDETTQQWLQRLGFVEFQQLSYLHYQLRFDPKATDPALQEQLASQIERWVCAQNPTLGE